jgi:signal transduction histidine kinase
VISVVGIVTTTALISAIDSGAQAAAQGLAAALCFYSLAGRSRVRTGVDVALFAATLGAMALTRQGNVANGVVAWLLFLLLPYVVGRAVASRRGLTRELQAGAEWARREQEADAHAAAAEERARIAREIHDVVAHSLSVMVIQAVAAREVAAHDPATARAALQAVQLSGREALLEMRRLISCSKPMRLSPTPRWQPWSGSYLTAWHGSYEIRLKSFSPRTIILLLRQRDGGVKFQQEHWVLTPAVTSRGSLLSL